MAESGCQSEGSSNPERGLHSPLLDPSKLNKVTDCHKLLCQSSQEPLPVRGIASACRQKCSRAGTKTEISRVFQPTFLGAKRSEQSKPFLQGGKIRNGDTGNHQDVPQGVGYLNRFQGCLLPYTNTGTVQEMSEISRPGTDIPIQSSGKIRAGTKADLRFCRLPVRPQGRSGPTHTGPLADPSGQILEMLSLPACPVRQFMSLIGLLTATEKQVHLGRLHRRPIQWHLKKNWRVPESLEKVIQSQAPYTPIYNGG